LREGWNSSYAPIAQRYSGSFQSLKVISSRVESGLAARAIIQCG
jgi:hypothetical protein